MSVHSPDSTSAQLHVHDARTGHTRGVAMERDGLRWSAEIPAADGDRYWLVVDGVGPLVDPSAADLEMTDAGPVGVVRREWPRRPRGARLRAQPVVYELHVRGFARTFAGVRDRLGYLADLGVDVVELMPIHPFDTRGNYWGYMPIVWGAIHRDYAAGDDAAEELAELAGAAHARGMHLWLDVVFNHTGEGDATKPTWTWRGLDDRCAYVRDPDGRYNDDAGCGNVVDVTHPELRHLVLQALQRFADLGIDGFRFDLASILTLDGGILVREIGDWAQREGIALVAEAWDLARYQVGPAWPDQRWRQWNDRFRQDVRGYLRAEPGMVGAMIARVGGSPDLFGGESWRSVNYISSHDGLTLHDVTAVTSDSHRSWDAGPELRLQQIENAFVLLLLSKGTAMFGMGDEFARTQHGHDNPYDVDGELTWVDWTRLDAWRELHEFVRALIALRRAHPIGEVRFHGLDGPPDTSAESRALAWSTGSLYVASNTGWDAAAFVVQEPGPWRLALATSAGVRLDARVVHVPPRATAVLTTDSG